ncbi:hypothetical protein NDU88_005234 [Pleurodeles waltl]|uniref:Uncharacterized protein n=1 Tax=Pleurodeles waltl TaxID=8319 RepID=A0AAV7TAE3_PLEWA|nr:hypothetical protein NDU88_005234 [Pleurodeles waltl]
MPSSVAPSGADRCTPPKQAARAQSFSRCRLNTAHGVSHLSQRPLLTAANARPCSPSRGSPPVLCRAATPQRRRRRPMPISATSPPGPTILAGKAPPVSRVAPCSIPV